MATDRAPVTPEVMRWARESIGVSVDEAARRAAVTAERIEQWESGLEEPTVAKLRALAALYQRPLAVFFLPEPPADFDTIRDFRRLPGSADHGWSRALHKVYRRALEQQDAVLEILEEDGESATHSLPPATVSMPPEKTAEAVRGALGITSADQMRWSKPEEALAGWIEAVEALGVLVLRTSDVSPGEMRGFSVAGAPVPLVVVNALDWPRGQVFTLLHEVAHLMLRQSGLCDLLEPESSAARRVEAWCNAVAAAALMPAEDLLSDPFVAPPGVREWDDEYLQVLGRRYNASQEAVLRRLVTLDRASMDYYLRKRDEYQAEYLAQREFAKSQRGPKEGGPPPHRMAIRDRGKPYVRLVLDAYHRDRLTPSSLARLLGLKLKHLPALEHEVRPR